METLALGPSKNILFAFPNPLVPVPTDIVPLLSNITLELLDMNCESLIEYPPILPPVNNTCEPLTSPFSFTLKLELEINIYLG